MRAVRPGGSGVRFFSIAGSRQLVERFSTLRELDTENITKNV